MLFFVANGASFFFSECASESIHRLKCALEERQFAEGESEVAFDRSSMDDNSHDVNSENAAWQELQRSQAGNKTLTVNSLKILSNYSNFNSKSKYILVIFLFFF